MSHATDWACRSCRAVLGQVRDGVLRRLVAVDSIDERGVARLPCPQCGRVRVWWSARSDSTSTALDQGQSAGHSTG
jgi:hypothetical protein